MLLFGKNKKEQPRETEDKPEAISYAKLTTYSGMRVEVTTFDGQLLFAAKLANLQKNQAQLQQYAETENSREILKQYTGEKDSREPEPQSLEEALARMLAQKALEEERAAKGLPPESEAQKEPLHVRIRGYSDRDKKAIYMEGFIRPEEGHTWSVEGLTVVRIGNDRAFFRLETDLEAEVTLFGGFSAGEQPCRVLNISVGGACIRSEQSYHKGDKFLLKVQLLEDQPMSAMFCEVLRITVKEDSKYEYGCRFLELNEEDQDKITQNIFAAQLDKRRKKGAQ